MMRLYVDPLWRKEGVGHIPLLYPFWGNPLSERSPFHKALFDTYSFDTHFYQITDDITSADLVLMPYSHNTTLARFPELIEHCSVVAKKHNKWLLIDGVGDIQHAMSLEKTLVLRYGGYRFEKQPNEIIVPVYADDLLERTKDGVLEVRPKSIIPTVGFAGWAMISWQLRVRTFIKELPLFFRGLIDVRYQAKHKGVLLRERVLKLLRASRVVRVHIVERDVYSAFSSTSSIVTDRLRQEFVDTIWESDYALDVRGDANASTRLFEILSLGRIPLIIDTQRNFPLSELVDYSDFSYKVDNTEINVLPKLIAEFHKQLSPQEFEAMQRRAREVYSKYFRIDVFTKYLFEEISRHIST